MKTLFFLAATAGLVYGIFWLFIHLPDPLLFVLLLAVAIGIVVSIWR